MIHESFSHFDWDDGNIRKNLLKHGLGRPEIEAFFRAGVHWGSDQLHSSEEERFLGFGQDGEGRFVIASFTFRWVEGERKVRPISVRYMHKKEIERYEHQRRLG